MRIVLVGSETGNAFMNELLEAVGFELAAAGVEVESSLGRYPDDDEAVFLLIPHEFFATVDPRFLPSERQLRSTIGLATEQAGSSWFEESAAWCARFGATFDLNPAGVAELRRRGVAAERFQLGYTRFWDRWNGDPRSPREVDVIHLGTDTYRRLSALASYADELWDRRSRILLPPVAPKPHGRTDYLVGPDKWEALASAKILLNLHREESSYLEWVRVLEAICNGAVVVTEAVDDAAPLEPGRHYVSGALENLAGLCCALLDEPERLEAIREEAYRLVREELPLSRAVAELANAAESVLAGRDAVRPVVEAAVESPPASGSDVAEVADVAAQAPPVANSTGEKAVLKAVVLAQMELRRDVDAIRVAGEGHSLEPEVVARTPSFAGLHPRVSVIVPVRNHAADVGRALASVAGAAFDDLELLVLDDGSTDDSLAVAGAFLAEHPHVPALLVRHRVNRGTAHARNELVSRARGELVFVLDADNEIYPTAIARLVDALDETRRHGSRTRCSTVHDGAHPVTLVSYQPWDPLRLRQGNYIDAMALIRRSRLAEVDGYTTDIRLYGWEDYDLWCKMADRGGSGVLVPEILGRYKRVGTSMISTTNIDWTDAQALLAERHGWPAAAGRD